MKGIDTGGLMEKLDYQKVGELKTLSGKIRFLQSAPAGRRRPCTSYLPKCCQHSLLKFHQRNISNQIDHCRPNTTDMTSRGNIETQRNLGTGVKKHRLIETQPHPGKRAQTPGNVSSHLNVGSYGGGYTNSCKISELKLAPRNMHSPFLLTQGKSNTWLGDERYSNAAVKDLLRKDRCRRRSGSAKRGCSKVGLPLPGGEAWSRREPNLEASKRFRVAILCVRILIKWLQVIIQISNKKSSRTATEEQWHTLYTSEEAQKLAFNKSNFARERAFAKVPYWAVQIFNSDPEERSENDCRRIHALLRGLKSFDKFTEKIQLSMCRAFRYICVNPGRIILRKGHVGFNFYFIYSGSVFVNIEDRNLEGQKFEKTECVLARGDAFGELALLQDIRRTASITCREVCEMLVVDKETFAKVCPKIFERELDEKERFLSQLNVFSNKIWTKEMVKAICTEAQIQEYKTNKVITTDDDEEWIYICMEGKCQIIRRLAMKTGFRRRTEDRRPSTPVLSDEILDILGKIKNVSEKNEDSEEDTDDESEGVGKERMLDSMSLEYRKDGRRRKIQKQNENKEIETKEKMIIKGPITLTSLMTQEMKTKDGKDYVYLDIGNLHAGCVFDLYCTLYPAKRSPNSTLVLVSSGSRMMRIKRKGFFRTASPDALTNAKRIGKGERYPTDEMLLDSYKDKANWDNYKSELVKEIVGPYLTKNGKFSKITNAQIDMMKERNKKRNILLSTLKRNTYISKATKMDQIDDEDDDEKKKEDVFQRILLLPHHHLPQQQEDPLPTDFSIGRPVIAKS